jgi:hypothetical protein
LKIKLDFNGIDQSDCVMIKKQNKTCRRLRKSLEGDITDLLIVIFDGVIGSFIHEQAFEIKMTGYE